MSAEGLKKAVLDSARREAGELVAQARAAAEQDGKQAAEQAKRVAADTLEKARGQAAREREQALAALEREQRQEVLAAKNGLLDRAFAKAAADFRALPMERLREIYRRELAGIDLQGAALRVPRGAKADFEALVGGKARVEEDPTVQAGYVVQSADFRLDRSLDARLDDIRAELRPGVAELLFGTGE